MEYVLTWDQWNALTEQERVTLEQLKEHGAIKVTPVDLFSCRIVEAPAH